MYTIIGGDGKEYGPVSVEQIRAWIAGGRANLDTKVKASGSDEWKTAADFPEIAGSAPAAGAAPVSAAGSAIFDRRLDIMSCYERSWDLLKANFWEMVGVTVVMAVLYGILMYGQKHGMYYLSLVFNAVISGGFSYYFLLKIRGRPATVGDAFAGFKKPFVTLVAIGLLGSLLITVGLICLLLPGIYLAVAYAFSSLLAVDRGLGFWEAMERSRRTITRNWWRVFGLLLLGIPFLLLGFAAVGVGILVAIPLINAAFVYAYEDLCNPEK
jgi:uncharacterized membrane protein